MTDRDRLRTAWGSLTTNVQKTIRDAAEQKDELAMLLIRMVDCEVGAEAVKIMMERLERDGSCLIWSNAAQQYMVLLKNGQAKTNRLWQSYPTFLLGEIEKLDDSLSPAQVQQIVAAKCVFPGAQVVQGTLLP